MIEIAHRLPTPAEYRALRVAVGWQVPGESDTRRALDGSVAGLCAVEQNRVIGMGRIVGDRAFYLFLVDLVVHPDYQGRHIGSLLLDELEAEAARLSAVGSIALVADLDVFAFYERRGFERASSALLTKALGADAGVGQSDDWSPRRESNP